MTKKTRFRWELACAFLVVGCGGSKSSQPSSYETTPASETPAEAQPAPTAEVTETPEGAMGSETAGTGTPTDTSASAGGTGAAGGPGATPTGAAATGDKTGAGATPAGAGGTPAAGAEVTQAEATITTLGDNATPVGTLTVEQNGKQVTLRGTFTGLKKGMHAIHIHEKGDCGGKAAKNAGAHFNPSGAKHGGVGSAIRHAGDFGNIEADKEGNATFEVTTDSITLTPGADSIVGRAVIIHAKKDDGKSQPAGNSGPPIACGVIQSK